MLSLTPDINKFNILCRETGIIPVVYTQKLGEKTALSIYESLNTGSTHSFVFNSGKDKTQNIRYSFIGVCPSFIFESKQKKSQIIKPYKKKIICDPLTYIQSLIDSEPAYNFDYIDHFYGGYVGYFSYDMVRLYESVPHTTIDDLNLPDICLYKVDELIVIDHKEKIFKVITCVRGELDEYEKADKCINEIVKKLNSSSEEKDIVCPGEEQKQHAGKLKDINKSEYIAMVDRVKNYIKEGDIYQANISHRICVPYTDSPFKLYKKLNAINPSPFSCFFKCNNFSIASSSPERLFRVSGQTIETRPIAGTRPRGKSDAQDTKMSYDLLVNEKEKAEHLMLIDLERNDLSRVCEYNSVEVNEFMALEKYSHVWHIVSNVRGRLNKNTPFKEIIMACFPGGTITGCPKIRCMEIIDEVEKSDRAVYTGSFGYIGYNKQIDLNILIRTVLIKEGKAYLQVGAGIVADSHPEKEYYETLHKAEALLEALQVSFE